MGVTDAQLQGIVTLLRNHGLNAGRNDSRSRRRKALARSSRRQLDAAPDLPRRRQTRQQQRMARTCKRRGLWKIEVKCYPPKKNINVDNCY